jgi:hypothetical protein
MPNHPTAPVFESVVGPVPTNCDSLKLKYGIVTRKHRKGSSNARKESHHILQEKAMKGLVSKYSGWAVLLNAGSGGEHDVVNAAQAARNCPGGGPMSFGGLLQDSTKDLEGALVGKVHDGNTMSPAEAKKVAACLVAEAEEETNKARKDKKKKPLTANSKVDPVTQQCLPAGTLVWLDGRSRAAVETLVEGTLIEVAQGPRPIARVTTCAGPLVEIRFGRHRAALAAHHRVRLANASMLRADKLRPGHVVAAAAGPLRVAEVRTGDAVVPLFRFALAEAGVCRIGSGGLWIEVPQNIVRVIAHAEIEAV